MQFNVEITTFNVEMMDKTILEYLQRFKDIRKEKQEFYRQRKIARYRQVHVEDLTKRFIRIGPVKLNLPTLLTEHLITTYFGGWDKIDLSKPGHLAAVICFYQNGGNRSFGGMDKDDLEKEVHKTMSEIDLAAQADYYVEALTVINLSLKKKDIHFQKTMLLQTLETLGIDLPENGAT